MWLKMLLFSKYINNLYVLLTIHSFIVCVTHGRIRTQQVVGIYLTSCLEFVVAVILANQITASLSRQPVANPPAQAPPQIMSLSLKTNWCCNQTRPLLFVTVIAKQKTSKTLSVGNTTKTMLVDRQKKSFVQWKVRVCVITCFWKSKHLTVQSVKWI